MLYILFLSVKIVDADVRRRSVTTLKVPKFFGDVGDGTKTDIVNELNTKKTKGHKAYTEGMMVDH